MITISSNKSGVTDDNPGPFMVVNHYFDGSAVLRTFGPVDTLDEAELLIGYLRSQGVGDDMTVVDHFDAEIDL